MYDRRRFLRDGVLCTAGGLLLPSMLQEAVAGSRTDHLTILHTNDMHSRIDPFPAGDVYAGQGGMVARGTLIDQIRRENPNLLLFDSGDIFQGTPYFNFFLGEPEIKLMSAMGYDAATMGNHDFDLGIEGFVKQMPHARFPFIVSNYQTKGTALEPWITPFRVFTRGSIRIGVYGLGIQLKGLVPDRAFEGIHYIDPVGIAREMEQHLKFQEHCHLIVALSHLGYRYTTEQISDCKIAKETRYTHLILGGHTHTFMDAPDVLQNKDNQDVIISQAGWGGLRMGRLDIYFNRFKKPAQVFFEQVKVSVKTS